MACANSRRVALLAAAVLLVGGSAAAKDNSLEPGSWALQFGITNNFTLGNFGEAGIAVKRHFSGGSALRAGMQLSVVGSDVEASVDTTGNRSEFDQHDLRFTVHYLWYPRPDADINLFVGAGPLYAFGASEASSVATSGVQGTTKKDSWSAGGEALLGVEWFVVEKLGIHAEYALEGIYTSREDTTTSSTGPTRITDTSGWVLKFGNVLLGLSVYF